MYLPMLSHNPDRTLIVGFTTLTHTPLPLPTAQEEPTSYSAAKLAEWREHKRQAALAQAAHAPGCARIAAAVVLDIDGRERFAAETPGEAGHELLAYLLSEIPAEEWAAEPFAPPPADRPLVLGWGIRDGLAIAAVDLLTRGPVGAAVPLNLWRPQAFTSSIVVDPVERLRGAFVSDRHACQVLELPDIAPAYGTRGGVGEATCAAVIALSIAQKFGLLPARVAV